MKGMKKIGSRLVALLLAFCMCLSAFGTSASAAVVAVAVGGGTTTLSAPTITSASVVSCSKTGYVGEVKLQWKRVTNATGYQVEFKRYSNSSKTTLLVSTTTNTTQLSMGFAYKSALVGQVCTYRVRAYKTNSDGSTTYSAWSTMKTVTNVIP